MGRRKQPGGRILWYTLEAAVKGALLLLWDQGGSTWRLGCPLLWSLPSLWSIYLHSILIALLGITRVIFGSWVERIQMLRNVMIWNWYIRDIVNTASELFLEVHNSSLNLLNQHLLGALYHLCLPTNDPLDNIATGCPKDHLISYRVRSTLASLA